MFNINNAYIVIFFTLPCLFFSSEPIVVSFFYSIFFFFFFFFVKKNFSNNSKLRNLIECIILILFYLSYSLDYLDFIFKINLFKYAFSFIYFSIFIDLTFLLSNKWTSQGGKLNFINLKIFFS